MKNLTEGLQNILTDENLKTGELMSSHTTFRVGGPADWFVRPQTAEELADVIALCRQEQVPFYILGNGSNLLVGDYGYRGVMIDLNGGPWGQIAVEGNRMRAGAGAFLSAAAKRALESSLTGLEFAAGIPGTVGGAVVMNAGAYGSEMKEVLVSVKVLTTDGQVETIPAPELELGYRTSCIPKRGYVVLEAEFKLEPGDAGQIRETMADLAFRRRDKQPLEYPSAGSTFKRPEGHFAGKLIQDAGLRGFSVGGAQVSEKHCGFVVNRGGASAADILELCRQVQERVQKQFGVTVEMEVKCLGDFNERKNGE